MNRPELYSKNNTVQERENNYFLDKYLSSETWKDGESILEIGMGDGKYTVETFRFRLPRNLKRYVATDVSEEMVQFAKKKYGMVNDFNIEFRTLDAEGDSIPDEFINHFDHVVSFLCFHWIVKPRRAAENIFNMLKPGGKLAVFFLEKNTAGDVFFNMSQHPKWGSYGYEKYISDFLWSDDPQTEWENAFLEVGFVNIRKFSENRTTLFPDEMHFNGFNMALDPVFSKIPEEDKDSYLKDYLEEARKGKLNFVRFNPDTKKKEFGMNYKLLYFVAAKPAFSMS
ncbi:juvenile hormone acid O-methyltransferase-like [Leptinotarsa decemlineata]|uniref:juvenile hormone acid O-methyltransferase-like n=1 Tax=Leptinotarsa decemlineata TaxID=7539 RepID=UPI003D30C4C6